MDKFLSKDVISKQLEDIQMSITKCAKSRNDLAEIVETKRKELKEMEKSIARKDYEIQSLEITYDALKKQNELAIKFEEVEKEESPIKLVTSQNGVITSPLPLSSTSTSTSATEKNTNATKDNNSQNRPINVQPNTQMNKNQAPNNNKSTVPSNVTNKGTPNTIAITTGSAPTKSNATGNSAIVLSSSKTSSGNQSSVTDTTNSNISNSLQNLIETPSKSKHNNNKDKNHSDSRLTKDDKENSKRKSKKTKTNEKNGSNAKSSNAITEVIRIKQEKTVPVPVVNSVAPVVRNNSNTPEPAARSQSERSTPTVSASIASSSQNTLLPSSRLPSPPITNYANTNTSNAAQVASRNLHSSNNNANNTTTNQNLNNQISSWNSVSFSSSVGNGVMNSFHTLLNPINSNHNKQGPSTTYPDNFWCRQPSPKLLGNVRIKRREDLCRRKLRALAMNPVCNDVFLTASDDMSLSLWKYYHDTESISRLAVIEGDNLPLNNDNVPDCMEWDPRGNTVALGFRDAPDGIGYVSIAKMHGMKFNGPVSRKLSDDKVVRLSTKMHSRGVSSIKWLRNSSQEVCGLVTSGQCHNVMYWKLQGPDNTPTASELLHSEHSADIRALCCHSDTTSIISGSFDGTLLKYDIPTKKISTLLDIRKSVTCKMNEVLEHPLNPNVLLLSTYSSNEQRILLLDQRCSNTKNFVQMTLQLTRSAADRSMSQYTVPRWSPCGYYASSGHPSGLVAVWDIRCQGAQGMNDPTERYPVHEKLSLSATWHATKDVILSISHDRNIGILRFRK